MGQYLPVLFLGVLAVIFGVVSVFTSHLLAPKKPNPIKQAPYECGIDPVVDPPDRFPVKFFLIAMIFIVFDVEIIFFYPWAVAHGALGLFGLVAVLIFSFTVFETFVYLISNGALNWVSSKVEVPSEEMSVPRSALPEESGSTIRRIPNRSISNGVTVPVVDTGLGTDAEEIMAGNQNA